MRKAHLLKPNMKNEKPRCFIFFDTETAPERVDDVSVAHRLKLGVACYWWRGNAYNGEKIEWLTFTDSDAFWEWATSKIWAKTKLYLVSHNLDFDLAVTKGYEWLQKHGYKMTKYWEKAPSRIIVWRKGNKTLCGIDNGNYFRGSLEEIGKSVGLEKLKVDFETCSNTELETYCKRDVEILLYLWKKWLSFAEENNLGNFMPTLASQAFTAFRHRFMEHRIFIHDREDILKLEREAYHGGRTECFYIGQAAGGPWYYLDVNSMYPHVMKTNVYPTKLIGYRKGVGVSFLSKYLETHCVIARVRVVTEAPVYPVKIKREVVYPVGEFEAVLSTPELKFGLQNGLIVEVGEVAVYDADAIFVDYVNFFYSQRLQARENGDSAFAYFYKIMLNSLYGKFGQQTSEWEVIGKCDPSITRVETWVEPQTGKRRTVRYHNGIVEMSSEPQESYNSFPAVAAHVTAYGRMYLWSLIEKAGMENVYYVDTDSLILNEAGFMRLKFLVNAKELGMLKLVKVADTLVIRAPKDYTFGEHVRLKGVRSSAKEIAPGVFEQEKWCGYASRLRTGNLNVYIVEKQVKRLSRKYKKGVVTESGRVRPFILPEELHLLS
ncbi:MAG: hypothetical protein H5U03_00150 [Clostridia bacterium]|nr:hypothetical protein [Clostridia bacterium]